MLNYTPGLLEMTWGRDALISALNVAMHEADEEIVESSPWVPVANSVDEAEEGGYYLDFTDTDSIKHAFNMSEEPSEELMAMLTSGEWYFDPGHGTVTGYIFAEQDEEGTEPRIIRWVPDNYHLFSMLRVRPVIQSEPPTAPESPGGVSDTTGSPSFLQTLWDLFQRIINFFRNLFNR